MVLFTIAALPRGGTMWFSNLFTTDRSYCFHELTTVLQPYPVNIVVNDVLARRVEAEGSAEDDGQRRMLLDGYPTYFQRLWEREQLGQAIVGNSDSGALELLPALYYVWPRMKFVLSVRDGIKWVQSKVACQDRVMPAEAAIHSRDHPQLDFFTLCCGQWAAGMNDIEQHREFLAERGADFVETSLEKITTDEDELRRIWDWLIGDWDRYAERNRSLMRQPLNVKANSAGVTPSDAVWLSWSERERATFLEICGPTQERLGYAVPEVGDELAGVQGDEQGS